MLLDLDCPIELIGYDLTHDGRGVRGFVRLFNIASAPVREFEAVVTWRGADGALDIPLKSAPVDAMPCREFVLPVETGAVPAGSLAAFSFVRVDFEDAPPRQGVPPWQGDPARLIDVPPPPPPSRRELDALQLVAGPDALVRPALFKKYWLCACARANARATPTCARCGRLRRSCLRLGRQLAQAYGARSPADAAPTGGAATKAGMGHGRRHPGGAGPTAETGRGRRHPGGAGPTAKTGRGRPHPGGAGPTAKTGRGRRHPGGEASADGAAAGSPPAPAGGEASAVQSPPDKAPLQAGDARRPAPAFSHRALREHYLRQRSLLVRRTVTMLTAALLIALTALLWAWLSDMQKRAREMVPPTRIEEPANPTTT